MRIQVGDVGLDFDVAGMGLVPDGPAMRERPVVVCLHGGPGFDHTTLKHYLVPLEDVAQLVFLDQRGNGRSDASTPERWNLDTWIGDVRGFCEALGLERPIILGQSFGGIVGLGAAIRYPELPAKLIVSSSIARFRLDRALSMFERRGGVEARAVAERYFRDPGQERFAEFMATCLPLFNTTPLDREMLARVILRPEVDVHFTRGEAFSYDWFPGLGRIRCPTLILAGEHDPVTTVADHEEMAAAIPGSRLQVFADAGHGVFRDKPVEALRAIREFILAEAGDRSREPPPVPVSAAARPGRSSPAE
jgi:pimeloyl-ACP methyl ester carboxylesterase